MIDNDGLHIATEKTGTIALAAGLHPITIEWFNRTGDAALNVKIGRAGAALPPIDAATLLHSRE